MTQSNVSVMNASDARNTVKEGRGVRRREKDREPNQGGTVILSWEKGTHFHSGVMRLKKGTKKQSGNKTENNKGCGSFKRCGGLVE